MIVNKFLDKAKVLCFLLSIFMVSQSLSAADRISIGVGDANEEIDIFRVGLQRDFTKRWLMNRAWGISGYWEASLGRWEDGDAITALGFSPVFIYSPNRSKGFLPYIEAGIGVALINNTNINDRDLASAFQFEDRIGFGARFGDRQQHDVNFRFLHYSNAGITEPNDGIDIFSLSYGYAFK